MLIGIIPDSPVDITGAVHEAQAQIGSSVLCNPHMLLLNQENAFDAGVFSNIFYKNVFHVIILLK